MFSKERTLTMIAVGSLLTSMGSACGDGVVGECFEKVGAPVKVEMNLEPFTYFEIHDDIEVELVEGSVQKVELLTTEGLLPNVEFVKADNGYIVQNTAPCRWTRKYEAPKLRVTAPALNLLVHKSAGPLYSKDTVSIPSLWLAVHESYSDINLVLVTSSLVVRHFGKSNVTISGRSMYTDILIIEHVSKIDCSKMLSNVVVIDHGGLNTVEVAPLDTLRGDISNTGSLVVHGRPGAINVALSGSGQMLFVDP